MNYKGELKGFPKEVVEKMLERQVDQGNERDVTVFEQCKSSTKFADGFDWDESVEGHDFWNSVLYRRSFNVFFEKYPILPHLSYSQITNALKELEGKAIITAESVEGKIVYTIEKI